MSGHPSWEIIRPHVFYKRYKDGTLGKFDAVFTYSSVEHSGLGKLSYNHFCIDVSVKKKATLHQSTNLLILIISWDFARPRSARLGFDYMEFLGVGLV